MAAPKKLFLIATCNPLCASDTTSHTSSRPRFLSLLNSCLFVFSVSPDTGSTARIAIIPQRFIPVTINTAMLITLPSFRIFSYIASIHNTGYSRSSALVRKTSTPFWRAENSHRNRGFHRYVLLIVCYVISYIRRKIRKQAFHNSLSYSHL